MPTFACQLDTEKILRTMEEKKMMKEVVLMKAMAMRMMNHLQIRRLWQSTSLT